MIATRLLVLFVVVLIAAASGVAAFASSAGRPSHAALTEQARAYYKQYMTAAVSGGSSSDDHVNDMSTCANITAPPHFVTPQDLGEHDHGVEWWFYVGLLTDSKTKLSYGLDFTLWRFASSCGDPTAVYWFLYLGIADEKTNTYYSGLQPVWGPMVNKNKGNTSMNIAAPNGMFSVVQDPTNLAMFSLTGWVPQYQSPDRIEISFKINSINGDTPMAEDGFSRMAAPGRLGSAQLEATRLKVLGGQVSIMGQAHTFDMGDVYLQHMWESTTDWMPADPNVGWDWGWGILDNGWSYSVTHLRSSLHVYTNYSYLNVIRPGADGKLENIFLRSDQWTRVGFEPIWTSPHTNVTYTLGHRLTIPSLGLVLDSVPLIHDNEVNWHDLGFRYYEGIGRVNGTLRGVPFSGSGGTELVGLMGMK